MEAIKTLWKFISNARYLKGIGNKSQARLLSIDNPWGDYYVLKLEPAQGFSWEPGQHLMLSIADNKDLKREFRMLSIASIEEERVLLFATRTGQKASDFKEALLSLEPGSILNLRGGFGWFRVRDDSSPLVIWAGGVGITPVRALVKELAQSQSRPIHILHSSSDFYLFSEEIEELVSTNPSMSFYKLAGRQEVEERLEGLAKTYGNQAYYFVSGSPSLLASVARLLRSQGVAGKRIIDDSMRGY